MAVIVPALSPYNDLVFVARLWSVDPTTGTKAPMLIGTVRAFLTDDPDPSLDPPLTSPIVDVSHIKDEKWLVSFDGDDLTPSVLDALFADATPYLVVETTSDRSVRVIAKLAYVREKFASVA